MQPRALTAVAFTSYPAQARALAIAQLPLLQDLPPAFLAIFLRELITYDDRFPAERRRLDDQITWLHHLSPADRHRHLEGFTNLRLTPDLDRIDSVNDPASYIEKLTASLWSSHQMETFRSTADAYSKALAVAMPEPPPSMPRLGIVVVGEGVAHADLPLFRKLRPLGVHLTHIQPAGGLEILHAEAARRAGLTQAAHNTFGHWTITGGPSPPLPNLQNVSYDDLADARRQLLRRTEAAIRSGTVGPEGLRTLLARLHPSDIGLSEAPADAVLSRFQLSLLTEGSGTQIFSTTFVQWAARECLRRAQPETLLLRYAPRQTAQTIDAMLRGASLGPDPAGSLVDADMGAFYTFLNLSRLSGAEDMRFLAWFEDHSEAVAIGPGLPRGTTSNSPMSMHQVLKLLA